MSNMLCKLDELLIVRLSNDISISWMSSVATITKNFMGILVNLSGYSANLSKTLDEI